MGRGTELLNTSTLNAAFIETREEFLNLIWISITDVRFLAPEGESRTLQSIVNRFETSKVTFEELASDSARPDLERSPNWFARCVEIANEFDWLRFGELELRCGNSQELAESPAGSWYIHGGNHRAIVAAVLVSRNMVPWQPIRWLERQG